MTEEPVHSIQASKGHSLCQRSKNTKRRLIIVEQESNENNRNQKDSQSQ